MKPKPIPAGRSNHGAPPQPVEQALRDRDALLQKLSEQVPGVIYQFQQFPDGRSCFPYASEGIRKIYEVTPEQVRESAEAVFRILHPDDLEAIVASIQQSAQTLRAWHCLYRVRLPIRGVRWLEGDAVPERLSDGSIIWHGYIRDITERKQDADALQHERDRLRQILDSQFGFVAVLSPDGVVADVNQTPLTLMGLSRAEVLGKRFVELGWLEPDTGPQVQAAIEKAARGETVRGDVAARFPGLGRREVDAIFSPLRDATGRVINVIGFGIDITERKQAETMLQRTEELYRRAITGVGAVPYDYNYQSRTYRFMSPEIVRLTGYRAEEFCPTLWQQIIQECIMLGEAVGLSQAEASQRILRGEIQQWCADARILTRDGKTRWLSDVSVQKHDAAGRVIGSTGILMDITERKQSERHIQQLNRVYAVLSDVNQLIVREKNSQSVLEAVCQIAVQKGKFRMAWIGMLNPETKILQPVASSGAVEGYLDRLKIDLRDPAQVNKPAARCVQSGEHALCNDIARDPLYLPWRDEALRRGYHSSGGFPLKVDGQVVGTFNLYASESGFFVEEELRLLDELALDISFALDLSRREAARRDVEAARDALLDLQVQLSIARVPVEVARSVFSAADRLWKVDAGTLNVYLPDQDLMQAVVNFDVIEGQRQDVRVVEIIGKPTDRIRRIMGRGGELVLRRPPFTAPQDMVMFGDKTRRSASLMHVPIRWQERAVGILSVQSYTPNAFTEADLRTLQGLADHCGGTLERIRADAALRASEERFQELAGKINEVFWITDACKQQVIYVSPAYERIWGRTCASLYAAPDSWLETLHPDDRARIKQAVVTKQPRGDYDETYRIQRPDGAERWIHDRAFPVRGADGEMLRVVGTAEDITARRELEEQFRQSQKMEAIGQLAGGVAHDFNNILAALMMQAELICMSSNLPEEARDGLQQFRTGIERAANLIRQLLLFSRRQVMQARALDLNEVVTRLAKMLQRFISENVRLQLNLHPRPLITVADSGMLDQVLLNLVVNARDAMPGGGRLIIETTEKIFTEEEAAAIPEAKPGRHVCLRVTDSGEGIAPEHLPHIFEPFFTTKEPGKGTGLGLATVFGIVKQHGGSVAVRSEPGKGATFLVFLRAVESAREDSAEAAGRPQPRGGTETILLVEDEPSVRRLTQLVLERAGYHVLDAPNGVEALRLAEQHQDKIHLLFTDIVMPEGINGRELAARLQARNSKLKVIFTSGYSADIAGRELSVREGQNFLQKPCPPHQILETIRQCLDE